MPDPVDLDALAHRYAVPDPGVCSCCGTPLVVVVSMMGKRVGRCPRRRSDAGRGPVRCVLMNLPCPPGDPDVLALVAEVRRLRGEKTKTEAERG